MISSSKSVGAVGSETAKHSKHPVALRLFYYTVIAIVGAALLPVIPAAAAKAPAPQVSSAPSAYTAVNPTRVMDTRTGSGIVGAGNTLGPAASFSLVVAPNATAGVPANATAVVMNVTATDTTAASYLTVYPTLDSLPFASNLNWVAGYTVPNLVTVQPGSGGAVTFYNKFGSVDVIADIAGYFAPPSGSAGGEVGTGFPQRLVDTRAGSGHLGAGSAIGPAATATYQVTGNAGVPATGVSAVILNSTVTNTTAASFLTLWAGAPATRNTVSNDNWVAGWTRANRVIVPVSSTGSISVYNQFGSVDVILDVNGYFTDSTASGKLFTSVSPIRLADHTALGPNSSFNLSVGGVAGVPVGASAAILDAVVSETTAPSFLTASPSPGVSSTSDINWVAGQVNPNLTVTTLGTGGQVNFYNSAGNVNVSVDLEGYFGAAAGASVVVSATPASVPADNVTNSTLKAVVTQADGTPANLDFVNFTLSGTPAGACGTITTTNPALTDATGTATATYKASTTVGTCTVTATEANKGNSGTTVITQTKVANTVTVAAAPASILANGVSTSSITSNVTNTVSGPIVGDVVTYSLSPNPAGSCGTLSASTSTTGAGGNAPAVTYTSSTVGGFCTVTATEAGTGSTATTVITQHGTATNTTVTTATPASIAADGKTTSVIKATVSGNDVANDFVSFTLSGAAKVCGTLSSSTATTSATGVASVTYTSSTTAGVCTVTATEVKGGSNGPATVTQTAVPNNIAVTATPSSIPADGATTSSVKATVTSGVDGTAINPDSVTFTATGAACGTLTGSPAATNTSGVATVTYKASTTVGFCTITATDGSGGTGSTTITQTSAVATSVTVTANPTSIPADNVTPATSTVTAAVKNGSGGPVPADSVNFTFSGAACGTVVPNPQVTDASGNATVSYHASAVVGSCSITATEASQGKSGSVTITQTAVVNTITTTATPSNVATNVASASQIASTVTNPVSGPPVGDVVSYSLSGNPTAACGTLATPTSTTAAGGVTPNDAYSSSTTVGFCTITATEAGTGSSTTVVITQHGTATNGVTVAPVPASVPANGASTSTLTATVTGNDIANDLVAFTLVGTPSKACGTLSSASATTDTAGHAAVTYTASTTAGTCVVTVTEAKGGSNNSGQAAAAKTVTQTAVPNNISLAANPATIKGDGVATSSITATVTSGVTSAAVPSDVVNFTFASGICGSLSAASGTTDTSGMVSVTYTSANNVLGTFCTIRATETGTGATTTVTITQTT
jgi:hypothetical protein